ncbi:hypothetical protein [Rossellomorea marisflavi]|uniref:hypothetical protein n=1 Tax=Rossellomorea marisflavi TaxID=189381 RepID=UPI003FA14C09
MLKYMTIYFLTGYVLPPLLFMLWNHILIRRNTRTIFTYWQRKEAHIFKEWSLNDRLRVEDELRFYIKNEFQSKKFLGFILILNLFFFPPFFVLFTLGTMPWLGWLFTLLLIHADVSRKKRKLLDKGLPFNRIVTNPRVLNLLRIEGEYKRSLFFPYLFIKSYHRLLEIPDDIRMAIRESESVEDGQKLISILTQEEEWLVRDMNTLSMGRLPAQYMEEEHNEKSEALKAMLSHASDMNLPVSVRHRAMELATALQNKRTSHQSNTSEFNRQENAELDILTVEKYYLD